MLDPLIKKNDRLARIVIITLSLIVFLAVVVLSRVQVHVSNFDVHIFAKINAIINSIVSILLLFGLITVKNRKIYKLHRNTMIAAMILSALFLVSYIAHHLLAGDTKFGGQGTIRYVYYFILITHIFLAAIILPFILYTAYRAAVSEWPQHRKLARVTWPIWFYVSVTGVLVYLLISPYYS